MAQPVVVSGADLAAAFAATGGVAALGLTLESGPADFGGRGPDGKPAFGASALRVTYSAWRLQAAIDRCRAYLEAVAGAA